ncbi:hypothetical protein RDI58_017623 [Solanum bulbocastanum]|uniref:Uncharacterized protein n=1 Tax=Solanum bulbocastanum TaxID=147425 RepID=A0AAN8TA68_SOLBU
MRNRDKIRNKGLFLSSRIPKIPWKRIFRISLTKMVFLREAQNRGRKKKRKSSRTY